MHHSRTTALAVSFAVLALLLTAAAAIADNYVALGDSYSSGVGTKSFYESTCKRSEYAYPRLLARDRAGTSLTFRACSGATTSSLQAEQLGSLSSTTNIVTVTIGGNDAGFSSIVTQCALPWPWSCEGELTTAEGFIRNTLPSRLDSTYAAIRSRAPNARVIVLGYPRLFMGVDCNAGTFFSGTEMSRMNAIADLLSSITQARATAAGFTFKNAITLFTGHAVCSSSEWLNGLSNPVEESFHPNRSGHSGGYEPLVRAVIG
ncbi:MAG TPA: SGNH/GDSL hydrolase family protein [Conexibacter sp.]|jgi:lysophospholipase L1-like esterase|nr:SGNH/GDSL hydrolase family protein [Conexibacter sp.]